LVIKDGILYLVATPGNSDDIERLALHRIRRARMLQATGDVPATLSLREDVEGDRGFGHPTAPDRIEREALFEAGAARDLLERTLAPGEYFSKMPDGRLRLETRVEDTAELRRWLLGFGNRVE